MAVADSRPGFAAHTLAVRATLPEGDLDEVGPAVIGAARAFLIGG
jgi:hypothetical protein